MQKIQKRKGMLRWIQHYYQHIKGYFQRRMYKHAENIDRSGWRLIIGYLSVLPILVATLLLTLGLQRVVTHFALEDGVLVLAIAVTSLLWGWGPALLLTFLGMAALDFFVIPPIGIWSLIKWPELLQLLPFCLAGLTIGILSRLRDQGWITARMHAHELAEANQKLEHEAQLKDRFLSMTSHELKTPLTSIRMQSQILERRLKKQATTKENASTLQALEKIDERTGVLANMIDELLDLSRTQQHQMTWKRELLDMNTLCQEVVEDQRLATGRVIQFQGSAAPATIWGDAHRLTQVVSNLVSNALKYSSAPSPIEVSVDHDTHSVTVQVRDHGQGIEQDQVERVFEPFYRTSEAQSSTSGGLGLGLAITKQIVDFHEGQLWCLSERGQGSTFFVRLPFTSHSQEDCQMSE